MPAEKYVFSPAAYAKTVLHATNYPAYAVSGLFLGKAEKVGDKTVLYVDDTLPLFHTFNQLTPMVSVGIEHGQILGEANGCKVVGYYYAGACIDDKPAVTPFTETVMKLIVASTKEPPLLAVSVLNKLVSPEHPTVPLKFFDLHDLKNGKTAESGCFSLGYLFEGKTPTDLPDQESVYELLRSNPDLDVCDFETHLDTPAADYTNAALNKMFSALVPKRS